MQSVEKLYVGLRVNASLEHVGEVKQVGATLLSLLARRLRLRLT